MEEEEPIQVKLPWFGKKSLEQFWFGFSEGLEAAVKRRENSGIQVLCVKGVKQISRFQSDFEDCELLRITFESREKRQADRKSTMRCGMPKRATILRNITYTTISFNEVSHSY